MRQGMAVLGLTLLVSGCAGGPFEWKYGYDKIVPGQHQVIVPEEVTDADGKPTQKQVFKGTVLTWPSHAVGAIVSNNGKACLQSAQSAKARNRSGGADLNVPGGDEAALKLWIAQQVAEAVGQIQDKNDLATYADVALFHICMMSANGALTSGEVDTLVLAVVKSVVDIAKSRPDGGRLSPGVLQPDKNAAPIPVPPNPTDK